MNTEIFADFIPSSHQGDVRAPAAAMALIEKYPGVVAGLDPAIRHLAKRTRPTRLALEDVAWGNGSWSNSSFLLRAR